MKLAPFVLTALLTLGCSAAQQSAERTAPVVLPILARSLACLLDAYKEGADTPRTLSTACLPGLVEDVAAADAAAHAATAGAADGGAK